MSIYEVTNLDTGDVELVSALWYDDLKNYFTHVKIAALDPNEDVQVVYYLNDNIHNENGPAVIYYGDIKEWFIQGRYHNENGPAVVYSTGHKQWYINGKLHNENGPAIIWSNGGKQWYINNEQLTEEEFNEYLRSHKS